MRCITSNSCQPRKYNRKRSPTTNAIRDNASKSITMNYKDIISSKQFKNIDQSLQLAW